MKPETSNVMPSVAGRALRVSVAIVLPLSLGACTWFTDFKNQPRIEPWEPFSQNEADSLIAPRGQPAYSVPVQGTTVAAWQIGYQPLLPVIDSFTPIPNPTPVSEASLANGRKQYQINCAVCHGNAGDGNGGLKKVNPAYGFSPSLMTPSAMGRSEGYIYGMIRNGRGIMPSYNRIEEKDRWDVVNYVRALQGKTTMAADTTSIGYPGQNGTTVPGPSFTAPTRPAPVVKPTQQPTPGSPNINAATFKGNNENDTMRKLHLGPPSAAGEGKEKHE
ncbi:MAG: c-type cytochrome [Gemmatimonadaceae bacterium]